MTDELRNLLAEAMEVERRLRYLLHCAEQRVIEGISEPTPGRTRPAITPATFDTQPYPCRTRPQKMAPAEFQLTPIQLRAGTDEGLLVGQVRREWMKFKDHTFATARQDWDATWRNWIRGSADRLPRLGRQRQEPPPRARPTVPEEPPADRGDALVSIRGIIDKLSGGKKL